jgi:hypothetical protein
MAGMIRKILRAAVAQPWDYMGEGAPDEWEFRISPDENTLGLYDPGRGHWVLLDTGRLTVQAEVKTKEMDRRTDDWARYVEQLDEE